MTARIKEGIVPYKWGTGIEITPDRYINVRLRAENNLIICNGDNELYTDLQLVDWLTASDTVPVWVLTGKVLEADWRPQTWVLLSRKTTSGDVNQFLWWNDWNLYFRDTSWVWHTLAMSNGGNYKTAVITDDGQGNVSLQMQYLALMQSLTATADSINWLFLNRGAWGQVHIEIVDSLPAVWSADTIYFVSDGQGGFDEYVWDVANNQWINVWGVTIDLSNYVTLDTTQTIRGQKIFTLEPVLPAKTRTPTNNPTSPATEAQLYALAQEVARKQDTIIAGDWIDITRDVVSIDSSTASQGQVLTKGSQGVEWTTPQSWGQDYYAWVWIDIDLQNNISIDTNNSSNGQVLTSDWNGWVNWTTPSSWQTYHDWVGIDIDWNNNINIDTSWASAGQVLSYNWSWVTWVNQQWGWGGWTTYHAWDWISIDSNHYISVDKTWASQWKVMSVDSNGNIVWITQAAARARIYYLKDDNNVDTSSRDWVYVIDPATMTATWETYTPQDWDILICYITNWCKIGGTYAVKDVSTGTITTYTNTPNPSIRIWSNNYMPIYVRKNLADYYHFHIGAGTWIQYIYLAWTIQAINTEEVVDVYEWEAWRLVEAIREMRRTYGNSISQADYTALVNAGQVDPDIWYHIHA